MVRFDLIEGKKKAWKGFLEAFEIGDEITFSVNDWKEIDCLRTTAGNLNNRRKDIRISVLVTDKENLKVTVIVTEK